MDTHKAIRTRRTAHLWQAVSVPDEVIRRGLEAAHCAPCHRLTWPWRFVLPGPVTRDRLFEIGVQLKATKTGSEITDDFRRKMEPKLLNPALVVVTQRISDNPRMFEEDYAACACAIQNLCLSVHADGFYSKWSTGGLTTHAQTYEVLGVASDVERIIGFVWIGTPARVPSAPKRSDLDEHTRRLE